MLLGGKGLAGGDGGERDAEGVGAGGGVVVGEGLEDVGGGDAPLHQEAVGGETGVERAAGDAVEVWKVAADDPAELAEVEVGVRGLEGIEGPVDGAEAAPEGVFALGEFEDAADAGALEVGEDADAVGVEAGVLESDEGEGEADDGSLVKSAENFAGKAAGDGEDGAAFDVAVGVAPDAVLEVDEGVEFFGGGEGPDLDGDGFGHGGAGWCGNDGDFREGAGWCQRGA